MARAEKHLYLLRHAKSSWDDPGLADRDRPLAPRGRRAAKAMGDHLRREHIAPAVVLCSSARRAEETLERIAPSLSDDASNYKAAQQVLGGRYSWLEEGIPDPSGEGPMIAGQPEQVSEQPAAEAQAGHDGGKRRGFRRKKPVAAKVQ